MYIVVNQQQFIRIFKEKPHKIPHVQFRSEHTQNAGHLG